MERLLYLADGRGDERFWGLLTLLIFQRLNCHEGILSHHPDLVWPSRRFYERLSRPSADAAGLGRGPVPPASCGCPAHKHALCVFQVTRVLPATENGWDLLKQGLPGGGHPWCARLPRVPWPLVSASQRPCTMQWPGGTIN